MEEVQMTDAEELAEPPIEDSVYWWREAKSKQKQIEALKARIAELEEKNTIQIEMIRQKDTWIEELQGKTFTIGDKPDV